MSLMFTQVPVDREEDQGTRNREDHGVFSSLPEENGRVNNAHNRPRLDRAHSFCLRPPPSAAGVIVGNQIEGPAR